ncbi:hypothetical protein KVR01_012381 [Diaporthe batatas]|uniref:uncharacterized protein n=1 Tax=Diaporthe batatas TaxID=748121 RepID=UPI001D055BAC|nr:uncharacterized protein KVR01_012381 [Diaporthe batatas]KAG8157719.1 hypothetical protein KVR01_012381 [Diaporthe batatas]
MTITSTPTHLPQSSVGDGPPGDSVLTVTETVLVDTVLTDTVSLVTGEKDPDQDPEDLTLDGFALSEADEVCIDRVLELADGDGTTEGPEGPEGPGLVGAQEISVLPDDAVGTGSGSDKLLALLDEGTLEISVVADDGVPVEPLKTGPEGEEELRSEVPLGTGIEDSTELLGPPPDVVTELEASGVVTLLGGPVLFELVSPGGLGAGGDAVPNVELGLVVPEGEGFVVVGCALAPSLPPLEAELAGGLPMLLLGAELGGSVMGTLGLSLFDGLEGLGEESFGLILVLEPGMLADPDVGTVPDSEVDAVLASEDRDSVLLSLLEALVSTAELTVPLTDPEDSEDVPLDAGFELAREDGAEVSVGPEGGPVLGAGGLDTAALEVGPLGDEDSVYGPPVDDPLDTVGSELTVHVSTSVVVRSVIWEVDAFVAIVVARPVVIVMGRLEDQLTVSELSTDKDDGDAEPSGVEGADSDDDVWAVEALEELSDVSAEDGTVDSAVPEDETAEEEVSLELWQKLSAGCHLRGRGEAFSPT